jgi:hypothetical protein
MPARFSSQLRRVLVVLVGAAAAMVMTSIALPRAALAQTPVLGVDSAAPYTHYRFPSECAIVGPRREYLFWRDKRADTVYHPPMGDLPLRFAVASTKECVSRFTAADLPAYKLLGDGLAWLGAQEWTQADGAFTRLLGLQANASPHERAWTLSLIVKAYADTPGQMATAQSYRARLDALGDVAAPERMLAGLYIAKRAAIADSLSLLDSALTAALTASRRLTHHDYLWYGGELIDLYKKLADLYLRRHDVTKAKAILVEGRAVLASQVGYGTEGEVKDDRVELIGKPAPPLKASVWYGAEGTATVRPALGKPTLIVFMSDVCGELCYPGFAMLRRLYAKYAGTGLQVVLVARTWGFSPYNTLMQPDSEPAVIQQYFTEKLHLPQMAISVWQQPVVTRPRDGLVMRSPTPNEEAYQLSWRSFRVCVVDRKGIIQAIVDDFDNEQQLNRELAALR